MKLITLLLTALLLFGSDAQAQDANNYRPCQFKFASNNAKIDASAQILIFRFQQPTSDCSAALEVKAPWINVDLKNDQLQITVQQNDTALPRSGQVLTGRSNLQIITIHQDPNPTPAPAPVSPDITASQPKSEQP